METIRRKLLCIGAWPLLLFADIGIAACGIRPYREARSYTKRALGKIWNGA